MGTLVRQARRRILGNELFRQGANSGSAALGAFILLLLFGTQILNWQFLLPIPIAAAAFGIYRVIKRLPSPYAVAQVVDQRMALSDSLSTALFFDEVKPDAPVSADVRRAQFEAAGRLAEKVDLHVAVPYRMPRSAYATMALLVVALGLFGLRYGISRQLDLSRPIANFLPDSFTGGKPVHQANNNTRRNPKEAPLTPDEGNASPDQDQQNPGQQEANQETQTPGEAQSESPGKSDAKSLPGQKSGDQQDDQMASDDQESEGDGAAGKDGQENQDGKQGEGKSGQPDKQQSGKQKEGNTEGENSLMNKMKDAFQNLLSKVKPQQNQQGQQQQGQEQAANKQGKQQQGSKQQQGKEGQPEKGGQQGDSQEGEDGQQAKDSENAQQGKGQGKSDSQQSTKQPGSGVGSQDGDKAIKNAEQLAAMGKISEILGKRASTVSGEATVEVQTTSQQLRTPYAQRSSEHTQSGAEISRDEVPVALQPYVQQYFEQLRKQAPPAAAGTPVPVVKR